MLYAPVRNACKLSLCNYVQVVEVRARLQRALGRPFPLEEVTTLTLAKLRELEAESGLIGRPAAANPTPIPADDRPEPGAGGASVSATNPAAKGLSGGGGGAAAAASAIGAAAAAAAGSIGSGKAAGLKAKSQQVSKPSCMTNKPFCIFSVSLIACMVSHLNMPVVLQQCIKPLADPCFYCMAGL